MKGRTPSSSCWRRRWTRRGMDDVKKSVGQVGEKVDEVKRGVKEVRRAVEEVGKRVDKVKRGVGGLDKRLLAVLEAPEGVN